MCVNYFVWLSKTVSKKSNWLAVTGVGKRKSCYNPGGIPLQLSPEVTEFWTFESVGLELTAESKQSQNDCQLSGSPVKVGMLSFGSRLVAWLALGIVVCSVVGVTPATL